MLETIADGATAAPAETTTPVTTTTVPATTTPTTTTPTTTTTTTTTTTPTTTTTTLPPLDVHDPSCVIRAATAGSLEVVAAGASNTPIAGFDLWAENDFPDRGLVAGDLVDVCVENGVNDITGEPRVGRDDPLVGLIRAEDVKGQQRRLNELFAGYGIADLDVDGIAGPRTRQRLCAARLALGHPASTAEMQPGTAEHLNLFTTDALPTPASTAIESERWILIDRTCQIMFIGEGRTTIFVFPTSTGSEGFETRDQNRTPAFRFDPALENGGWHNSSEYPVGIDNPLNGNLYKPLYFDLGQAIHGANSVPASPASKGCARLQVRDQETLLGWLGLGGVTTPIWRQSEINVTVNVQGEFNG